MSPMPRARPIRAPAAPSRPVMPPDSSARPVWPGVRSPVRCTVCAACWPAAARPPPAPVPSAPAKPGAAPASLAPAAMPRPATPPATICGTLSMIAPAAYAGLRSTAPAVPPKPWASSTSLRWARAWGDISASSAARAFCESRPWLCNQGVTAPPVARSPTPARVSNRP
ncbi:hypothetical protein D3C81_596160 [compost metagenome]